MFFRLEPSIQPFSLEIINRKFNEELDNIINFNKYSLDSIDKDYDKYVSKYDSLTDLDNYYPGDEHAFAVDSIGSEPLKMFSHLGLMSISRAVSLTEYVLAAIALRIKPEGAKTVFKKGKLWQFRECEQFFEEHLADIDLNEYGFVTLRKLRNIYAHGYGIPRSKKELEDIYAALKQEFDHGPPTEDELQLGYTSNAHFFMSAIGQKDELPQGSLGFIPIADPTPLMTYRTLECVRKTIVDVLDAI